MRVITGYRLFGMLMTLFAIPGWAADVARASAAMPKSGMSATTPRVATVASSAQAPAVVAGSRSIDAAGLAHMGRQFEEAPATTIYESRLSDGTLVLSDRPPPTGASAVERHSYLLPQDGAARQRAEAERAYWRQQADGFERRQRDRERDLERGQRVRTPQTIIVQADHRRRGVYHGYGWMPPEIYGGFSAVPGVSSMAVQPLYSSSPGAVQGRAEGGFIGSGFPSRR